MITTKLRLLTLCVAVASTCAMGFAAPAGGQICNGDCNGNRSVAIDEIIVGIRIAFGDAKIGECQAMDSDGDGAVSVNELVAAVNQALQGCDLVTPTPKPTRTNTPVPTIDEAALASSARVATESIMRLFDMQASVDAAARVAARARVGAGGSAASGCQQLDCARSGTQENCCSDTQFSQFFTDCTFDDDLGRVVTLNGLFDVIRDSADVCTGAIPTGASFAVSIQNFTQDIFFPDGSFSRTFAEVDETFKVAPGGCTLTEPDELGFGVRGDGRRSIDGEVQHFHTDGVANVVVDSASEVHPLQIEVSSTHESAGCTVTGALRGTLTGADFTVGSQFSGDFSNFHFNQIPQADALDLTFSGTVGTDCLGAVTLSTVEPLRVASGDTCLTGGRLEAQLADGTVSLTSTESGGLDLDFGADGSVDQHFASCTDVPADRCETKLVGLCGACTTFAECQTGLGCFPCIGNCSGDTMRCSLPDTFVTCEDGDF